LDSTTRALIDAYLEKAERKLAVAKKLAATGDHEDAVSRAYYAAFHAAQALLLAEGQRAETHRGLLTLFALLLVKPGKIDARFGKFLANLKDDREASDDETFSFVDQAQAQNAIEEAQAFLDEARRLLSPPGTL
jgi:uncharacterized protein (UPF0332 family)